MPTITTCPDRGITRRPRSATCRPERRWWTIPAANAAVKPITRRAAIVAHTSTHGSSASSGAEMVAVVRVASYSALIRES